MISLVFLNTASDEEFVAALKGIYEHSDWVPRRAIGQRPFVDLEALIHAMSATVDSAADGEKLSLIRAHPDLAGKLARAGNLTEESTREQAGLGLDRLADAEYEAFTTNNENYRSKFGFPFIICARMTTQKGVLDAFAKRLGNSREEEISEAILQIHHIARLRLQDAIGDQ